MSYVQQQMQLRQTLVPLALPMADADEMRVCRCGSASQA